MTYHWEGSIVVDQNGEHVAQLLDGKVVTLPGMARRLKGLQTFLAAAPRPPEGMEGGAKGAGNGLETDGNGRERTASAVQGRRIEQSEAGAGVKEGEAGAGAKEGEASAGKVAASEIKWHLAPWSPALGVETPGFRQWCRAVGVTPEEAVRNIEKIKR